MYYCVRARACSCTCERVFNQNNKWNCLQINNRTPYTYFVKRFPNGKWESNYFYIYICYMLYTVYCTQMNIVYVFIYTAYNSMHIKMLQSTIFIKFYCRVNKQCRLFWLTLWCFFYALNVCFHVHYIFILHPQSTIQKFTYESFNARKRKRIHIENWSFSLSISILSCLFLSFVRSFASASSLNNVSISTRSFQLGSIISFFCFLFSSHLATEYISTFS